MTRTASPVVDTRRVEGGDDPDWSETLRIYRDAFPAWEREDEARMRARVETGRYVLVVARHEGRTIGFHALDLLPGLDTAFFMYLAVDRDWRGRGIGRTLCRDVVERFRALGCYRWLLVEAGERQAVFYGRMGFLRLAVEYHAPRFDGPGSVPMDLLALPARLECDAVPGEALRRTIRVLFADGYELGETDPRIAAQLERVPGRVALEAWPPTESRS
jgi:GNAT superfamily N-acetyltransferase